MRLHSPQRSAWHHIRCGRPVLKCRAAPSHLRAGSGDLRHLSAWGSHTQQPVQSAGGSWHFPDPTAAGPPMTAAG
jgi:hypothetical protein